MAQRAAKLLEDQLTPIQKLRKEIDDVRKLQESGALTSMESSSIIDKMVKGFAGQAGTGRATAGAAVEAGSREAYSLTRFGNLQKTTEKGVWDLVKKTEVSIKTEKDILAAIKKANPSEPAAEQIVSIP
jgi:hypothetical protein